MRCVGVLLSDERGVRGIKPGDCVETSVFLFSSVFPYWSFCRAHTPITRGRVRVRCRTAIRPFHDRVRATHDAIARFHKFK